MLSFRAWVEKGILPRAGGLNDQHPLYVAAMEGLFEEEALLHKEARDEARRK